MAPNISFSDAIKNLLPQKQKGTVMPPAYAPQDDAGIDPSDSFQGNYNRLGEAEQSYLNEYQRDKDAYNKFDTTSLTPSQTAAQAFLALLPIVAGRLIGGNAGGAAGADAGAFGMTSYTKGITDQKEREKADLGQKAQASLLGAQKIEGIKNQVGLLGLKEQNATSGTSSKSMSPEALSAFQSYFDPNTSDEDKVRLRAVILQDPVARQAFYKERGSNIEESDVARKQLKQKTQLDALKPPGFDFRKEDRGDGTQDVVFPDPKIITQFRQNQMPSYYKLKDAVSRLSQLIDQKGDALTGEDAVNEISEMGRILQEMRNYTNSGKNYTQMEKELNEMILPALSSTNLKQAVINAGLGRSAKDFLNRFNETIDRNFEMDSYVAGLVPRPGEGPDILRSEQQKKDKDKEEFFKAYFKAKQESLKNQ